MTEPVRDWKDAPLSHAFVVGEPYRFEYTDEFPPYAKPYPQVTAMEGAVEQAFIAADARDGIRVMHDPDWTEPIEWPTHPTWGVVDLTSGRRVLGLFLLEKNPPEFRPARLNKLDDNTYAITTKYVKKFTEIEPPTYFSGAEVFPLDEVLP